MTEKYVEEYAMMKNDCILVDQQLGEFIVKLLDGESSLSLYGWSFLRSIEI